MTDWDRFAPSADRAIVTGAGSGMGRAIALRLARAGVKVYVVGRREEALAQTAAAAKPGAIVPLAADIRDPDRIESMFAAAEQGGGVVPLLVNAASGSFYSRAENISPGGFNAVVNASLNGPFFVLRRWARALLEVGSEGSAVMITSAFAGREEPGVAHSVAAKAGLEALVRSVAAEWGDRGLRVNALAPGAVKTEGAAATWDDPADNDRTIAAIALKRFGDVEEIADAAMFLLGGGSSYITGSVLVVDGGWRLTPPPFGLS
jgi:NAD(P)-dependent dehydrogenase (short-subunit alcohol dehydrogenase family)